MSRQTNAFNRGSAPERARDPLQRPGSFKPGRKKLGGRKKGTPNRISAGHKKAMREAAHRIGYDGNGKDGEVGYFKWVAERDLTFFYVDLWSRLLEVQEYHAHMGDNSTRLSINEVPRQPARRKKKTTPLGWLRGADDPYECLVQDYMRMAMEAYKSFCKFYVAAFLTPPKNWRAKVAQRQRDLDRLRAPAIPTSEEEREHDELKFKQFCALFNAPQKGGTAP